MEFLKHFLTAAGIFVAIDAVWLTAVAGKFYKKQLGHLLAKKPNLVSAAVFYAVYIVALVVFIINPGLRYTTGWTIGHAALLGFAMYATYDLTNDSTLKDWPRVITLVDLAWGTTITTLVSTLTVILFR